MNISSTLTPVSTTKASARYQVEAGAVTVTIGGRSYPSTGISTVEYSFSSSGDDHMVITTTLTIDGIFGTVVGTVALANGSFGKSIIKHPAGFSPTPQNLTPAKKSQWTG